MFPRNLVHWEESVGKPVTWGAAVVVPHSRALVVRLPFGGFVWHRPIAVEVERGDRSERVPIRDVTRTAQVAVFGSSLLALSAALFAPSRQKE